MFLPDEIPRATWMIASKDLLDDSCWLDGDLYQHDNPRFATSIFDYSRDTVLTTEQQQYLRFLKEENAKRETLDLDDIIFHE